MLRNLLKQCKMVGQKREKVYGMVKIGCLFLYFQRNHMSAIIQYDLFKEKPTEQELLSAEIDAVRLSCDKVRKKLFAENGDLKKRMLDLETRLEIIERMICQKK